ncbi:hypothetical protein, conserved [Plasmodium ovale wallikeri]|uniref:Uncharacterized protein n=1 Tax=Plasmodium ovale wallikeri TaxID=864142 RepID=A0A1A8ZGA0_PLAOA|nr:hypothetical protein, conserved [Plasmodium ovale wallikeri]
MLCLDKEDELKIYKKYHFRKCENNEILKYKDSLSENSNTNVKQFHSKQNDDSPPPPPPSYPLRNKKNNVDCADCADCADYADRADRADHVDDMTDEIIYISTSTCNSFIFIITKFCFYIYDNYDFSFVNFHALKHDDDAYKKYGYHGRVFLSPFDNTVYIISKNLVYVYAYKIRNKHEVVMLDYEKNVHTVNISDHSDNDSSSGNENEYYEYITYIKRMYRKKTLHKYVSIKLVTMLFLPIPSNCLIITKRNVLFFSYNTDEIFISDNIKTILANSAHLKDGKGLANINKVVINTRIVNLKSIYSRKGNKNGDTRKRAGQKKKGKKKKKFYGEKLHKDRQSTFNFCKWENKKKKKKTRYHYFYKKKGGLIRRCCRNSPLSQNIRTYCNRVKHDIISAGRSKKKRLRNTKIGEEKYRNKEKKIAGKKKDYDPFYLYSSNGENNLFKFFKNKNSHIGKYDECRQGITIEGISKVEFYVHNDYLLLLSRGGDFYIFSFFHNFFNFSKGKACYHSGKRVHGRVQRREAKDETETWEKCTNDGNRCGHGREEKKCTNVEKNEPVIGLYIGHGIADMSMNIHRKLLILITADFTIKGYSTHPYICKHTFRKSIFTIDTFSTSNCEPSYYNFLLWNKQHNFFLVSFNQSSYYIYNTNGTLYYSRKIHTSDYSRWEKGETSNRDVETKLDEIQSPNGETNHVKIPNQGETLNQQRWQNRRIFSEKDKIQMKRYPITKKEESDTELRPSVCLTGEATSTICNDFKNDGNLFKGSYRKSEEILQIERNYVHIAFVFNDYKLFFITRKDEICYYINVKNFLYLNDIYSKNKLFHYNSNYYTNEYYKKIYIGMNNIVMFDANINDYNLINHEKNMFKIKKITTPFNFIKKSYINFNNTYMLIIFKGISIYSMRKKTFSYFVDNFLKLFFHNYPSGWLYNDVFFVCCLHNKYDENNFKYFKKKKDTAGGRNGVFFNRAISMDGKMSFELFNMDYGSAQVNSVHYEDSGGKGDDSGRREAEKGAEDEAGEGADDRKGMRDKDGSSYLESDGDESSNDESSDDEQTSARNKQDEGGEGQGEEENSDETPILNYLFNFNHNESDTYYKFFEEYFNSNKGNIYTKPFVPFYYNFFLKKDTNVFLKKYIEKRRKERSLIRKNQELIPSQNDYANGYTMHGYYVGLQGKVSNYIPKSGSKNDEDNNLQGYARGEDCSGKDDNGKNGDNKNRFSAHHCGRNSRGSNSGCSFVCASSSSLDSDINTEERDGKRKGLKRKNKPQCYYRLGESISFEKSNEEEEEEEEHIQNLGREYEEILNKHNFYYVVYFYNINNVLRFTNYIGSIRLLYRPILTHVYYEKGGMEGDDEEEEAEAEVEAERRKEKVARGHLNYRFLIILDAFYNLLCFRISEEKNNNLHKMGCMLTSEIVFFLPLNRDQDFVEATCFYSLFDIYNYVFLHYDNSISFLHIYKDNNNCYDFEHVRICKNKVDYLEIVKDYKNYLYFSLPTPIKHIWPTPIYYIYLFYYYVVYIIYNINRTNEKWSNRHFFASASASGKCREPVEDQTNVERKSVMRKTNKEKKKCLRENVIELPVDEKKETSLNGVTNKYCCQRGIYSTAVSEGKLDACAMDSSSFDLFSLIPSDKSKMKERYTYFENVFVHKLIEHSSNYRSLIRLKKKISTEKIKCWEKSLDEALFYVNNFSAFFEKLFLSYEDGIKESKEKEKSEIKNIYLHKRYRKHRKYVCCNKWQKRSTLLEKTFFSLYLHILRKSKNVVGKLNKTISKYNLFSILEELKGKEKTCYIYLGSKANLNVISISKCADQVCLMGALKGFLCFQKNRYINCHLIIYRYMKLNRPAKENYAHFHHIMHSMGLFISIVCSQTERGHIKGLPSDAASKSISPCMFDKIGFKINSYVNFILLKFLKLYSDVYSYRAKKYQPMYDSHSRKNKFRSLVVNTMVKYIRYNAFVINILDILLYKSLNKLNDFYISAYKIVYNLLTDLSVASFYEVIISKERRECLLNITIIVLYCIFLGMKYKEKKKVKALERTICNSIFCPEQTPTNKVPIFKDSSTQKKKKKENAEGKKEKLKEDLIAFLRGNSVSANPNDISKVNQLRGSIKDEHVYLMILYLLRMKKGKNTQGNQEENKEENTIFEIKSDYAYKMNCNVYYVALYLLCILKKRYAFHLFTLLNILRNYCKFHISEVVINIIRKMDPYISAILIYAFGNFTPHNLMELCLPKGKYNICSLYIINIQNYIGIYDVRKFYCMYFLYMSFRYNIKYAMSLIHYMSILFYTLFEKKTNRIFHWNYLGLEKREIPKLLAPSRNNSDNYLFFLSCLCTLNSLSSFQFKQVKDTNILLHLFENLCKREKSEREYSLDEKIKAQHPSPRTIYNTELVEGGRRKKNWLKIKSFIIKGFQMNRVIYEFFYNKDIIHITSKNRDVFCKLHTCNSNVFECGSLGGYQPKKQYSRQPPNQLCTQPSEEKGVNYCEVQNIYIRFILLIQNIVCYYIQNMLWFELYYFVCYLRVDILSFFSYTYFFKSTLFQNIFWGICPIDVSQHCADNSQFYFLSFDTPDKVEKEKKNYPNESNHSAGGNNSSILEKCNHLVGEQPKGGYNNCGGKDEQNDRCYGKNEDITQMDIKQGDKNKSKKGKKSKRSPSQDEHRHKGEEMSKTSQNRKNVKNIPSCNNPNDAIRKHLDADAGYVEYMQYMKKLKAIFEKVEKESEVIHTEFSYNESSQRPIFFIDIYKSFKNHFKIYCVKTKGKKKDSISFSEPYLRRISKNEMEKKRNKYRTNINLFNIYNKLTNYTFLETYFAPSVYTYIPIYNTLRYLYYFFNVCNINNKKYSKKKIKYEIKRRIYNYITNNIIDLKMKNIKNSKHKEIKKKNYSIIDICTIHKNDMVWFLLRIFLLLKLPIHALALILYCKNYVLLNILLNLFPYLYHIINYILNMNGAHFLFRKKEESKKTKNNTTYEPKTNDNLILVSEEFNKQLCEYCYRSILHYKRKRITPFSSKICEKIYKKKNTYREEDRSIYDHFLSCECLNNLIFLRKKLSTIRKSV